MAAAVWANSRTGVWRWARGDAILVGWAGVQAVLLVLWPIGPLIALGVWWNSNTISHNFIHRPFFRSRAANALFAAGLSLLTGIPQSLWRDLHLAHHAGVCPRVRLSLELWAQTTAVLALWTVMAVRAPG